MDKIKMAGIALFVGTLGIGAVLPAVMPQKEHSVRENRMLQTRPQAALSDILNGSYQEQYEIYLNDQMPFRDAWVRMAAGLERLVGRQEIKGVYIGKDGYLIEKNSPSDFDAGQIEENTRLLAAFLNDAVKRFGKERVSCLLLPDKAAAVPNRLPDFVDGMTAEEEGVAATLKSQLDEPDILPDMGEALRAHQEEYIYYRSDHHWTTLGAYYAYCVWAEATGHAAGSIDDYGREEIFKDFYGTSYNKAPVGAAPDYVELFHSDDEDGISVNFDDGERVSDSFYFPQEAAEGFNRYNVFFSKNTAKIEITTQADTKRRLLVIKDSFANCFIPFLAGDYERIIMVDFRYGNQNVYDLLESYDGVTDILVLYNIKNFIQDTNFHALDVREEAMERFDADRFFEE